MLNVNNYNNVRVTNKMVAGHKTVKKLSHYLSGKINILYL